MTEQGEQGRDRGNLTYADLDDLLKRGPRELDEPREAVARKVLENRLRRMAARQGIRLQKSRTRDPHASDYGTYTLVDTYTGSIHADWNRGYGLTLQDVAEALITHEPIPARVTGQLDREVSVLLRLVLEARGEEVTAEAIAGVLAEIAEPEDAAAKG